MVSKHSRGNHSVIHHESRLYGGVLVGGKSRRMGEPKPLISFEEESFFGAAVKAMESVVQEVFVVGQGVIPQSSENLPRVFDDPAFRGPLAGVAGVLSKGWGAWILLATDMPLISSDAIEWLVGQRREDRTVILPRSEKGWEPFPSLWEEDSLGLIQQDFKAPRQLRGLPGVYSPRIPQALEPQWRNINYPSDVESLRTETTD